MKPLAPIEQKGSATLLRVRIQPKASRNAVRMEVDGRIRIAVAAPAVEGAANRALLLFVADLLGLPKSSVALERGEKSREKTLRIQHRSQQVVEAALRQAAE